MLNFILILFVIISLILFIVTVVLIANHHRKLKTYDQCTGIIEGFWNRKPPFQTARETLISPVISYTVNGEAHKFAGAYCASWMQIGQEIELLYDKKDPTKVSIKKGLYLAPIITGSITLIFIVTIILLVFLKVNGIVAF